MFFIMISFEFCKFIEDTCVIKIMVNSLSVFLHHSWAGENWHEQQGGGVVEEDYQPTQLLPFLHCLPFCWVCEEGVYTHHTFHDIVFSEDHKVWIQDEAPKKK